MDKFDWYEFQKKQASESKVPWLREFYETPLPEEEPASRIPHCWL
ncbi:hypothetical protein JCM19241_3384 [Vibrio ishigakensis]|uniref:Uncharacterized protein n=1 Tax=Vibrio ishigakensis TaxID=1481914 RepID=A0A0B8QEP3_9VIBR|nr:hypothetical protein JCM19241_3384 [Vibrio ishigakensis]